MKASRTKVLLSTLGAAALISAVATAGATARPLRAHHAPHAAASQQVDPMFDASSMRIGPAVEDPNAMISRIQVPTTHGLEWETIETPAVSD